MKVFLFIVSVLLFSCGNTASTPEPIFSEIKFKTNCQYVKDALTVNRAVIVEAFFLRDFLLTANHLDEKLDTAEIFIEANRQLYYDVMDSNAYYEEVAKKTTDSLGIKAIVAGENLKELCFINKQGHAYSINLLEYHSKSGVFIFNRNTAPVYWESVKRNGLLTDFLKDYFH